MVSVGELKRTDENAGELGGKAPTFDHIKMIFEKGRLLAEMKA